jgi:hypothetical protein
VIIMIFQRADGYLSPSEYTHRLMLLPHMYILIQQLTSKRNEMSLKQHASTLPITGRICPA